MREHADFERRTSTHPFTRILTLTTALSLGLSGCYNVQLVSPDDQPVRIANATSGCMESMHERSHFLVWGLANIDDPVRLPGGKTMRIEIERDFVDGLLNFLGFALTLGIYAGSVSVLAYDCR